MGIYPRPRFLINKAELGKLYLEENKSIQEIATLFGYGGVRLAAQKGKLGHPGNKHRLKSGPVLENGYVRIYKPEHPRANRRGRVLEHIVVWEETHHQPLPQGWIVHHLNGIRSDNRPENLAAAPSRNHYDLITALTRRIRQFEEEEKKPPRGTLAA